MFSKTVNCYVDKFSYFIDQDDIHYTVLYTKMRRMIVMPWREEKFDCKVDKFNSLCLLKFINTGSYLLYQYFHFSAAVMYPATASSHNSSSTTVTSYTEEVGHTF